MPANPDVLANDEQPQQDIDSRQEALQLLAEGARLLQSRRLAEALPPLERAYALQPHDPDIAITLGGAMVMNRKWNKAVALLEGAVARHPENARLWLNLAAAYLGHLELSTHKRQDQAIAAYERAIELDPVAPSAHYNIGLIYTERADWEQAAAWFQEAVRANPADRDAAYWLKKARTAQLQSDET